MISHTKPFQLDRPTGLTARPEPACFGPSGSAGLGRFLKLCPALIVPSN